MKGVEEVTIVFRCRLATFNAERVISRLNEFHEVLYDAVEGMAEGDFLIDGTGDINAEQPSKNKE
jgi:hypothetical protein